MTNERFDGPTLSVQQVQRHVQKEASMKRRVAHSFFLALDAGMVVLLTALWTTEPHLPLRTHVAFGVMLGISVAWLVFFVWVLQRRRPLFALDRVIAARMALVFTTLFLSGGVVIAAQRNYWPGLLAVACVGGTFVGIAATMLVHATRTRRLLLQRRHEIIALMGSER